MTSAAPKPAWVYDRDAEWAQLFGMSGFTPALRAAARRRDDVELIDLERLYGGG